MTDFILPDDCCIALIKLGTFTKPVLGRQATYSSPLEEQAIYSSPLGGALSSKRTKGVFKKTFKLMKYGIFMIIHIYAKVLNRLYCSSISFLYHLGSDPMLITQPAFGFC